MAQSPEYPDLKWVPPKSWTKTERTSVQLIVIHTTEGSAHNRSAEDGAAYDARRTDGTSTHYFHDNDSTVQCVETRFRAHTARSQGNRRGIQHELCTDASTSPAGWADPYHQAMLRRAAKQAALDAREWGIPVRKLTAAEVRDGAKGFCGHADVTKAFPEDGGTHTDPGVNFPWAQFLALVKVELAPAPVPDKQEEDMADAFLYNKTKMESTAGRVVLSQGIPDGTRPGAPRDEAWQVIENLGRALVRLEAAMTAQKATLAGVAAELEAIKAKLNEAPPVT